MAATKDLTAVTLQQDWIEPVPHGQILLKMHDPYHAGYRNEYLIVSKSGFTHS